MLIIIRFFLKLYKKLNGYFLMPVCRHYPSCSSYSLAALERHGVGRGLLLTFRRLARCNQFFPGGYDPVPER